MNKWAKTIALAAILHSPLQAQNAIQTSIDSLGVFAKQSHATIQSQEELYINGVSSSGAYNRFTDNIIVLEEFTDSTHRSTLAHELVHAAMDTVGQTGLFLDPKYSGPTPKQILEFTEKWYTRPNQAEIRNSLGQHIRSLNEQHQQQLIQDAQKLEETLQNILLPKTLQNNFIEQLQDISAQTMSLWLNSSQQERITTYQQQNKQIDAIIQTIQQHPLRTALQLHNTQTQNNHTEIFTLSILREYRKRRHKRQVKHTNTYFTQPEETFARAIASLVQPTKNSTHHRYKLDTEFLEFIADMSYENTPLFSKYINRYPIK